MRLSDEKARQLTTLVWRDRARRWLPIFAGLLALLGVFTYYLSNQLTRVDRTVEVLERDGTVIGIKRGSAARGAAVLQVHLDDGRDVDAIATLRVAPAKGTHVVVAEARHASGKLTYDVVRLLDH
jgi:hypothetical protein